VVVAFRAGLEDGAQAAFSDADLAALLTELHARGVTAWPTIQVDPVRFASDLVRRLGAAVTPSMLAGIHHDVYLAIACADGDAAAIGACDELCKKEVELATSRLRATTTQGDDVRSELRRLLFTTDEGRTAAVLAFTGRGDLRGYARVIAARTLARRMRRDRQEVELDDEMIDVLTPAIDPEIAFLREQYRADVDTVFRAAIAMLPDRSRAVLRYHLLDGWSIDEIGTLYHVHRATAARWLTSAREDLGGRIRTALSERLAIPESQVDSIVALVTSRIEISLDRLLAPG
jgi:RNA polymerase sigma-70 factor (ECF subfamily)